MRESLLAATITSYNEGKSRHRKVIINSEKKLKSNELDVEKRRKREKKTENQNFTQSV